MEKKFLLQIKMNCKSKFRSLKKKFFYAQDFAKATMEEIFSEEKLKNSQIH